MRKRQQNKSALSVAIRFLARREYSRSELKRKLLEREFTEEQADQALDRLAEEDLQSDRRYVHLAIRSRASAGRGPRRIRAELGQHNLNEGLAEEAMEAADINWEQLARGLVERKYGDQALDFDTRRKAMTFLLGRGFTMDMARAATTRE